MHKLRIAVIAAALAIAPVPAAAQDGDAAAYMSFLEEGGTRLGALGIAPGVAEADDLIIWLDANEPRACYAMIWLDIRGMASLTRFGYAVIDTDPGMSLVLAGYAEVIADAFPDHLAAAAVDCGAA